MSIEGTQTQVRRVAIITGAAEGIGRGIAQRLAKDGLDLGLFDLSRAKDRLEELAEGLRKEHGARIVTVYGDVSKEDDVKGLVDTVVGELGNLYAVSERTLRSVLGRLPPFMVVVICSRSSLRMPVWRLTGSCMRVSARTHHGTFDCRRRSMFHLNANTPCSTDRGPRQIAQREHQGDVFLVQVRRDPTHQARHGWAHPRCGVDRKQERCAVCGA